MLASKHAEQCPFWLRKGCSHPDTCDKGERDPEFKGKGPARTKSEPPSRTANGKGDEGKGKGKGKDKGKGANGHPPKEPKGPPLPDDAHKTADGRLPCYNFKEGKCKDPNCSRYHGKFSKAMTEDYTKWAANRDQQRERQLADGAANGTAQGDSNGVTPKAKGKAKP